LAWTATTRHLDIYYVAMNAQYWHLEPQWLQERLATDCLMNDSVALCQEAYPAVVTDRLVATEGPDQL